MMKTVDERLDILEKEIKKTSFRENKGLGNEVGYYIFDYPPAEEMKIRERVEYIRKKYEDSPDGFRVIVFDLYEIVINTLEKKGYIEKTKEMEKKRGFDRVTHAVGNVMRLGAKDDLIVNYIKENTPKNSVVFLTGIGKCYPIIRSHTVLNNLHLIVDEVPVVMFYPGRYDGQELILFGEIKDDNYYRAFRIAD